MEYLSFIINLAIVIIMACVLVCFFRKEGKWTLEKIKIAMRFYTTLSNILCAISALCMCLFPTEIWAYYLKVIGTAAVIVTMLTVILFLSRIYGFKSLIKGTDLFLHLINPVLAVISLFVFERRGIGFATAFIGMIPVALYAPLYLYKTVYAPEEKRWDDFYAFNQDGKWWIAFTAMLASAAVLSIVLFFVLNL